MLEIVCLSVNEQFQQLMPSLYPVELATRPQPFDSIEATWIVLDALANNRTPAINSAKFFSLPAVSGGRVSASSGPTPAALGRGQGRATSQTSAWATGSQRNPVVMNVHKIPPIPGSHPRRTRTGRLRTVMKFEL